MLKKGTRYFSSTCRVLKTGLPPKSVTPKLSPNVLNTIQKIPYEPKVLTEEVVDPTLKRPLPLNVELNYYAPFKHSKRQGDLVAILKLHSYDHADMDFYSSFIQRAAYYLNIPVTGSAPLKTRTETWTVIRSPFAQAKSKENFQRHTHKRLIKAFDATPEVIDLWLSFIDKHSIAGVGMRVDTFHRESLNLTDELDKFELDQIEDAIEFTGSTENVAILERVQELLQDPVFKRHLKEEELKSFGEDIQKAATSENKK